MTLSSRSIRALAFTSIVFGGSLSFANGDEVKAPFRHYWVDAAVVSLGSDQSLASYQSHGKGGGSPGSTLGYSTPDTDISIALSVEQNHFYADATLERRTTQGDAKPKKERLELTSLKPVSLDLGAAKDGRTYQLHLLPTVKLIDLAPKPFTEMAKDLYRLKFHSSRIMLNDDQYIGRMMASDAEKFSMEICGVASLEFSLYQLTDAKPWGQLNAGQIKFSHPEGTAIEIGNVTNGEEDLLASGGPYTVWVRWKKPQQTVEEYRAALSELREEVKSRSEKIGAAGSIADTLKIIDLELAREAGPWVTSCGACGINKGDVVRGGE